MIETTKFEKMNKTELIAELIKAKEAVGQSRGSKVLELLDSGFDSIESLAEEMDITKKNVSSVVSALRKKGHNIINLRVGGHSILQIMTQEQVDGLVGKTEVDTED